MKETLKEALQGRKPEGGRPMLGQFPLSGEILFLLLLCFVVGDGTLKK